MLSPAFALSSTTMSSFILLNWDPLTHYLGIRHGKWQYYWYLALMLNIMKEELLKTSWGNWACCQQWWAQTFSVGYVWLKHLVVMILNYHQNKLICCTIQVWDPAILTRHQNTIKNILEKGCSQFKTVSIHFRKVWTTETEGKTTSKMPLKCPLWYSLMPTLLFIFPSYLDANVGENYCTFQK